MSGLQDIKHMHIEKTLAKEGLPIGTEKLIQRLLSENTKGFSETDKKYKIDGYRVVAEIFKAMKDLDYSYPEKLIHQLSYLGYVQSNELRNLNVGTVTSNKSKLDSYCIEMLNGTKAWYKFAEGIDEPYKDDMIIITSEGTTKRGRYVDKVITSYDVLKLDRNKQIK